MTEEELRVQAYEKAFLIVPTSDPMRFEVHPYKGMANMVVWEYCAPVPFGIPDPTNPLAPPDYKQHVCLRWPYKRWDGKTQIFYALEQDWYRFVDLMEPFRIEAEKKQTYQVMSIKYLQGLQNSKPPTIPTT